MTRLEMAFKENKVDGIFKSQQRYSVIINGEKYCISTRTKNIENCRLYKKFIEKDFIYLPTSERLVRLKSIKSIKCIKRISLGNVIRIYFNSGDCMGILADDLIFLKTSIERFINKNFHERMEEIKLIEEFFKFGDIIEEVNVLIALSREYQKFKEVK